MKKYIFGTSGCCPSGQDLVYLHIKITDGGTVVTTFLVEDGVEPNAHDGHKQPKFRVVDRCPFCGATP